MSSHYTHDYGEDDAAEVARVSRWGFLHEVHCYGIADGVDRVPPDENYIQYPEYMKGYQSGLEMEASKEAAVGGRD